MAINPIKTSMREQPSDVRKHNFEEVALGYSLEEAVKEAERCLQCKNPKCIDGCPVSVKIPQFIKAIADEDIEGAARLLWEDNSLPAVCGRVCPQENQCEELCILINKFEPVGIGRLERYAADWAIEHNLSEEVEITPNGIKVAIIGGGPAGLTAAGDLAKMGYSVTIFEAFHKMGGVLVYGIPEFRLPKELVKKEIDSLKKLGVEFMTNIVVGRTITFEDIFGFMEFKAAFIGTGAGLPRFMSIPGENLNGVYSANEYLTRVNLMKAYDPSSPTPVKKGKKIAVIGGGNVAMDAARCAIRMGAEEVHIIYRRSMVELPARLEEVHHAQEEGIIFDLLKNPVEIIGDDGWVSGIKVIEMELGEPDESGRRRPVEKEGSEYIIDVDMVIMSIGTKPNPLLSETEPELEIQSWGGIIADAEGTTTLPMVWAGGDAVTGAATVILAMGAGKIAAKAIHEKITRENIS